MTHVYDDILILFFRLTHPALNKTKTPPRYESTKAYSRLVCLSATVLSAFFSRTCVYVLLSYLFFLYFFARNRSWDQRVLKAKVSVNQRAAVALTTLTAILRPSRGVVPALKRDPAARGCSQRRMNCRLGGENEPREPRTSRRIPRGRKTEGEVL